MYFDSHAHYDNPQYDKDRDALLNSFPSQGIGAVINIGYDLTSSKAAIALAEAYPFVYAAVGVHPHDVKDTSEAEMQMLAELSKHKKVVAIGEIGLDFHYDHSPRDLQRHWFRRQLQLANELALPVVIHSREAAQECFDIISTSGVTTTKGVLHCYSGHLPMALEYIKIGFYIAIGGTVTYKNAAKTKEVAAGIPLERMLIETDAPYLSPVPFRGKRNDSTKLPLIAETIAELRSISVKQVAEATYTNTERLFSTV